jgi:hypothetical protein
MALSGGEKRYFTFRASGKSRARFGACISWRAHLHGHPSECHDLAITLPALIFGLIFLVAAMLRILVD